MSKEELKLLANRLMFEMKEEEYDTLQKEFDIILKQMDLIGKINDIDSVLPMTFPFEFNLDENSLRDDVASNEICFDDMKCNVKDYEYDKVKVPKVVE